MSVRFTLSILLTIPLLPAIPSCCSSPPDHQSLLLTLPRRLTWWWWWWWWWGVHVCACVDVCLRARAHASDVGLHMQVMLGCTSVHVCVCDGGGSEREESFLGCAHVARAMFLSAADQGGDVVWLLTQRGGLSRLRARK